MNGKYPGIVRDRRGRFAPGTCGRPKGTRNRVTVLAEEVAEHILATFTESEEGEDILGQILRDRRNSKAVLALLGRLTARVVANKDSVPEQTEDPGVKAAGDFLDSLSPETRAMIARDLASTPPDTSIEARQAIPGPVVDLDIYRDV